MTKASETTESLYNITENSTSQQTFSAGSRKVVIQSVKHSQNTQSVQRVLTYAYYKYYRNFISRRVVKTESPWLL